MQGDEPLIEPALIDACAALLGERRDCVMSTAAHPIDDVADFVNPNVVKVVLDAGGRALYFSRAPIPWWRDAAGGVAGCRTPAAAAPRRPVRATAPASCAASPALRAGTARSASKRSSSCACCGTASASRCTWPPRRPAPVSTRPTTWSACARLFAAASAAAARLTRAVGFAQCCAILSLRDRRASLAAALHDVRTDPRTRPR